MFWLSFSQLIIKLFDKFISDEMWSPTTTPRSIPQNKKERKTKPEKNRDVDVSRVKRKSIQIKKKNR